MLESSSRPATVKHSAYCLRAIAMNDAGEKDIYKNNLLEVMVLAKSAWEEVAGSTISNCWRQAFAPDNNTSPSLSALQDPTAWHIVEDFAAGILPSIPDWEVKLNAHLGNHFSPADWKGALDAICAADDDDSAAPSTSEPDLRKTEEDLMEQVDTLRQHTCACSTLATPEDLLNAVEETKIAREQPDIEVESNKEVNEDEEPQLPEITISEGINLCQMMESLCLQYLGQDSDVFKLQESINILLYRKPIWEAATCYLAKSSCKEAPKMCQFCMTYDDEKGQEEQCLPTRKAEEEPSQEDEEVGEHAGLEAVIEGGEEEEEEEEEEEKKEEKEDAQDE
ncbi:hypothetical protein NUW54_g558 [Trametes sanguinea]|uniref:Uncharacterized protein n=2 Tax=Trametes sanguinea TaxID=158606 RepID=A0ACC1Q7T4_9APHY|nr:hypothetical protein NUW54_g1439 [Trametes sanguinea]KAJ3017547.1 hypothetical protein NUW54_g558 [Trametes sanguinea]